MSTDARFAAVLKAAIGRAVTVYSPAGIPAFYLVPFVTEARACGYAQVDLFHRVGGISIFGSGPEDRAAWPNAGFFREPPKNVLAEIRKHYRGARLSDPVMSYDRSPARWAWQVKVEGERTACVFISPHGWYERAPDTETTDNEG